jgi:hypothetical protein
MTQPAMSEERLSRLEALVLIPNILFVGIVVLYLISAQSGRRQVAPLVQGERTTEERIAQLERSLERQPGNIQGAVELAKLYQRVGEFPWSYDALRDAERQGNREPRWRLMLGLAYLELGKNQDSVRVLKRADKDCRSGRTACDANVTAKLRIFTHLAHMLQKRGIRSTTHPHAAEKALLEILKPVEVDPNKMRPKAPAGPESPEKKAPAASPREPG